MPALHVYRDLEAVPSRVRAFVSASEDAQLEALAELYRRAEGKASDVWSNALLAVVPTLALLGAMLVAAYGVWTQADIAYWTTYADFGDSPGTRSQSERWSDAMSGMLDGPNALASSLTAWGVGLAAVLLVVIAVAIGIGIEGNRAHVVATTWIALYERALAEPRRGTAPGGLRRLLGWGARRG